VPKSGRVARTGSPRRALNQLAAAGATGVLHAGGTPGGELYLSAGQVTQASSPGAPDVGDLLVASGRLTAETWYDALTADGADHAVGRRLVERGHLTGGELELCALGALYDAAYFVLAPPTVSLRFDDDARHPLGEVVAVDATALTRECTRRRRLLDEIHPSSEVDGLPISAADRPAVPRVVLSALQWQLVVHADGRRTAAELAQLLGVAGYTVVQDLRRLAAEGLVLTGAAGEPPKGSAAARRQAVPAPVGGVPAIRSAAPTAHAAEASPRRKAGGGDGASAATPHRGRAAVPAPAAGSGKPATTARNGSSGTGGGAAAGRTGSGEARDDDGEGGRRGRGEAPAGTPASADRLPALPRRAPGARLPVLADPTGPGPGPEATDEALLKRIRTALKALR
jgi:hypothetical protein